MPRHIVRLETSQGPRYLEYSTIVDAPVTYGLTRQEFSEYWHEMYGTSRTNELERYLSAADAKGVTGPYAVAWDLLQTNRAGRDETTMSLEQLVDWYCDRRPEHTHDETDADRPVGVVVR